MYKEAAGWDAARQVAYGADLYAALLVPWFQAAGVDVRDRMVALFRSVADEIAPGSPPGTPTLGAQLGSTEGEFYEWHSILAG